MEVNPRIFPKKGPFDTQVSLKKKLSKQGEGKESVDRVLLFLGGVKSLCLVKNDPIYPQNSKPWDTL